jgi:hypothetical protein
VAPECVIERIKENRFLPLTIFFRDRELVFDALEEI